MKRGSCWDSTVQNSLVEAVSWFFSSHQLSAIHLLPPPQPPWGGEENHRKLKTLGWDKNSIVIEIKKNVIIIIRRMRFNKKESGELNPVKASDAQYNCPAHPWAAVDPCQTTLPSLYTGHDILWYEISLWLVWVNCPGCAPSQILLKLLTDNVWKTAKSWLRINPLTEGEHCSAAPTPSGCYWHYCHPESKTLPCTSSREKTSCILAETRTVSHRKLWYSLWWNTVLGAEDEGYGISGRGELIWNCLPVK